MNESLPHLPQPAVATAEDVIDLRSVLQALSLGRWTIARFMLLGLLGGIAYSWFATPLYRVDALVQIEKKTQSVTGSDNELYELIAGRDQTSTEIELLKSRMVLGRVVDQLHLDIYAAPRYFPYLGAGIARHFTPGEPGQVAEPLFRLRQFAWGGERIEVSSLTLPDSLQDKGLRIRAGAGGAFELLVRNGPLLGQGRVGEALSFMDGTGSIFVRDLVGAAGTEFNVRLQRKLGVFDTLADQLQVMERGKGSAILSLSLEYPSARDAAAIVNAIANAYQRQNVERRSAEAEQTLNFVNEQLPRVQRDLEIAENAVNSYRLSQKSADLTKETELVLQQSVSLEQKRLELQQKREESLRRFTANHPVIQALDGQLQQISREQDSLAGRVKGLPETQQELLRLSRDVQVNNSLYTSLLANAEQLRIAKAGTIGNVRIVDLALEPAEAVSPRIGQVLPVSLLAGTFLGFMVLFVRRTLHQGVSDPAVIERQFNVPCYATIPYAVAQARIMRKIGKGQPAEGILARLDPTNPAVEAIRALRTALHVSHSLESNNVIMVCGPTPALGKSFVSTNLAAAMAMAGRRVVLVDGDIRRGRLHQYASTGRSSGLSDAVSGRCKFEDMVHATPQENLFLVPTGEIPESPAELLLSPRFDQAIQWLSSQFDLVILDTAPVLVVADAVIAGRHAGTTLVVLRAGQHSLREIDDMLKRLATGKILVQGVVLNQVHPGQNPSYSGYYEYDYRPRKS